MRIVALAVSLVFAATPAFAQLGRLTKGLEKADKVKKIVDDVNISEAEERQIGEQVSAKIIEEFGVYQDQAVAKYVALVGTVLAQASSRPNLQWEFIVLDTDGVNAFAAPGGLVHITRGMLGLIKSEAELAGALSHEIIHIAEKHTINSIRQGKTVQVATDEVGSSGGLAQAAIARIADRAYKDLLNNKFDRNDEKESDEKGIVLVNGVGYAPSGLASVLTKLSERNKDAQEPNGLFASHPQIKDRISSIEKAIRDKKLTATATAAARYAGVITFDVKPASEVTLVASGARGLAGGEPEKKEETAKKEEPKKSGGLLGRFKPSSGTQAQNTQTVASAGARGINPDRDAAGGPNKKKLGITLTPAEIAEFRKGIA